MSNYTRYSRGEKVENVFVVAPSDSEDLDHVTDALFVGEQGDVKVDLIGIGEGITMKDLAPGVWHPIKATRVYDSDTTATDILGAY